MVYIRKLLNLITKNGKKSIAVKTVNRSLEKLKKRVALSKLNLVFNRVVPAVKIYKKKVAGKVYQLPAVIKKQRALYQTAKWVILAAEAEKKGRKLSSRLGKVILDVIKSRGQVWKLKRQYSAVIKENRSYMRFIRKKRIKKRKSWLFEQRFTTKVLHKEHKDRIIARKNLIAKKYRERHLNNAENKKSTTTNFKQRREIKSREDYGAKKIKFNKKLYRFVDFKRDTLPDARAIILRQDYDPNRNCKISLIVFSQGCLSYIIAAETNSVGNRIVNDTNKQGHPGDSIKLFKIATGSLVYNLTSSPAIAGQYIRAAGGSAILVKTTDKVSLLKLKSGEYRYFFSNTLAVLGKVNNGDYFLKNWRLAGKSRRLGIRPRNRALARNPVDHPMGGRTKGGTPKLTPKGKICLNTATAGTRNKLVVIKAREKKKI